MSRSGRKAALKVAFRNAVRNRKRTGYLVALIAVPVALAVGVAGFVRASSFTPQETVALEFGGADARARVWAASGESTEEVLAWTANWYQEQAPGTKVLSYRVAYGELADEIHGRVFDLDVSDPLAQGMLEIVSGAAPASSGEIAVSLAYAEGADLSIGDSFRIALDDAEREVRLVGLVSSVVATNEQFALLTPSGLNALVGPDSERVESSLLIDYPDSVTPLDLTTYWYEEGRYQFWPEEAVVPKPLLLDFIEDNQYATLSAEEVDELLTMAEASADLEVNGYDEAIAQRAIEMTRDTGIVSGVVPELYVEDRESYFMGGIEGNPSLVSTAVAAGLLVEVAFITGAAFAAGTRRRLREIGLLGSNGASEKHVRTTVLGEGLSVGLIGALVGVGLGIGIFLLARPLIQPYVVKVISGLGVAASDVVGPVLVAVASVVLAAWLPARTASRVPTTTALQGRMPALAPRRWVAPVGALLTGLGSVLVLVSLVSISTMSNVVVAVGAVMMVGGVALLASPILALVSRTANRFPATSRLVLRDSGRNRTRSAVAVAATMVILLAPITVLTVLATSATQDQVYGLPEPWDHVLLSGVYGDDPFATSAEAIDDQDVARLASILPERAIARFDALGMIAVLEPHFVVQQSDEQEYYDPYQNTWQAAVGNRDLVDALGVDAVAESLNAGDIVVLGMVEGPTTIILDDSEYQAVEHPVPVLRWTMPRVLIPESRITEFEDVEHSPRALFLLARTITDEENREMYGEGNYEIMAGYRDLSLTQIYWIVLGATLIVVLIVVALVTAVSAAETDEEIRTIVAVGAPGSIRRRFLGLLTGYQTAIAMMLAIPLGLLLVWVFSSSQTYFYSGPFGDIAASDIEPPMVGIAALAVSIPLLVGILTILSVRSAPVTPPRRPT